MATAALMMKQLRNTRPRGPAMIGQIPLANVYEKSEFLIRAKISSDTFTIWVAEGLPIITRNKHTYVSAAAWWDWMLSTPQP